jgi:hypothetical protein
MKTTVLFICIFITWFQSGYAQVWVSDQGNGSYKNPVLYADYSDPDLIRVGNDYCMTASSFNCVPGLPILHSQDLINWKIVNYALPELRMEGVEPPNFFDTSQHGKGVWAPCIRYHNEEYLIYWGDPDFGIYAVKTKDIPGKWDKPVLVLKGKGRIDPSPLFDDDGKVYPVHAWAGSRAGLNSILTVCELAWQQGDDLYSALDNRLLKGYEYVAKYNPGYGVPFRQWTDITGKYCDWAVISERSRGAFRPIYEIACNHFNRRKGFPMPCTLEVLKKIRPEGFERDEPAFGSLLFNG